MAELPPPPSQRGIGSKAPWVIAIILLLASGLLFAQYTNLNSNYQSLQTSYQTLEGRYSALSSEHTTLQSSYNSLSSQYSLLQTNYSSLRASYGTLASQYSTLQSSYESLQRQYSALTASYNTLSSSYTTLQSERNSLAQKITTMNTNFASLVATIELRTLAGSNSTQFITIDDPTIRSLVYQVTGGYDGSNADFWNDLGNLQGWVVQHISYTYDTYTPVITGSLEYGLSVSWRNDFWRFPTETVNDGHGDCEDMAILLTTMVRSYFKYYVGTLYNAYAMELTGPGPGHVAVVIPVAGGKIVILDPAGKFITGLELFVTRWIIARPAADAMNDYFSYWSAQGYTFTRVYAVFNESVYRTFSTLSEFITWIAS